MKSSLCSWFHFNSLDALFMNSHSVLFCLVVTGCCGIINVDILIGFCLISKMPFNSFRKNFRFSSCNIESCWFWMIFCSVSSISLSCRSFFISFREIKRTKNINEYSVRCVYNGVVNNITCWLLWSKIMKLI